MKYFKDNAALYLYDNSYSEFKPFFEQTGAPIFEGPYGRNLFLHVRHILKIIDRENVGILQTHFTMGEILGYLAKMKRPDKRLIITFQSGLPPSTSKKLLLNHVYKRVDTFVYISNYVRREKTKQFPLLNKKRGLIIMNAANQKPDTGEILPPLLHPCIFTISGLIKIKNIDILVEAVRILKERDRPIFMYVAGDGPDRSRIERKIARYHLQANVFLLGYQKNIGGLLNQADIYVHPAYAEGFGIAVVEAMLAGKPIIVSQAGALPELIDNKKTGLVVDAYNASQWASAISYLLDNEGEAYHMAASARLRAETDFSTERFLKDYHDLYLSLYKL
jgi:glycosyltransferase involved in cell wall biosynthesis